NLCGPEDGVDDEAAEVLIAPVAMEMTASEAEASAVILLALIRPGDNLLPPRMLLRLGGGARAVWRDGFQDRGHVFRFRRKADVEVPLILNLEWLDAASDGVLRQALEVGFPVRIDGETGLVIAAQPRQDVIALGFRILDGIVQVHEANALAHQL